MKLGVPQHRDRQHGEQARDVEAVAFRSIAAERIAQTATVPRVEAEFRLPSAVGPVPAGVRPAIAGSVGWLPEEARR